MAVMFVWLGVGSIKARRGGRAFLLVLGGSGLVMGTLGLAFLLTMVPRMMAQTQAAQAAHQKEMPHGVEIIVIVVIAAVIVGTYIILPGIWVLFYGRKYVKRTCELHDPKPRWTDRCPFPALGLSLWLCFGALAMLIVPFAFRRVFPLFCIVLVGWLGGILSIVFAAVWLYAAWALYRLDRRGWWVFLVAMVILSISTLITYSRHDPMEI